MRKVIQSLRAALALVMSLLIAVPAYAQVPALTKIGVAGGIKGVVKAIEPGAQPVGKILNSGAPLYLGEKIQTGPDGSLQVMLIDETVFTIGHNSSMVLDEFVYDPKSHAGKVSATVTNGVFRFVTGQIGHKTPSDMKVKFPVGTMGIRGTIVAGEVSANHTTAVLLGPGPNTNVPGERVGAFNLANNGIKVDVVKPGFGTHIDGQYGVPTPPAAMPTAQLNSILGQMVHPEGGNKQASSSSPAGKTDATASNAGAGPSASSGETDSSGQGGAMASADSSGSSGSTGETDSSGQGGATASADNSGGADSSGQGGTAASSDSGDSSASGDAGQGTASASGDLSNTQSVAQVAGDSSLLTQQASVDVADDQLTTLLGQTDTWDNIQASIVSGTGIYSGLGTFNVSVCDGVACNVTGSTNFNLNIDFGAQTIGGPTSMVTVSATDPALTNEPGNTISETVQFSNAGAPVSYAGLTGQAIAVSPVGGPGLIQHAPSSGLSNGGFGGALTAQVNLLAVTGPASHALLQATYVDASPGGLGGGATSGKSSMIVPCSGACAPH